MPRKEDKKRSSYLGAIGAAAPIFGAKALAEVPRKGVEETLEQKLDAKFRKAKSPDTRKTIAKALKGRGFGTAAGGMAGILTAPAYIKGVQLLGSDDPKDKAKGTALVLGSGAAYQAGKGLGEGAGSAVSKGEGAKTLKRSMKAFTGGRLITKMPAAILSAAAIAKGREKKEDGKDPSLTRKLLIPAAATGSVGAISNVISQALKKKMSPKDIMSIPGMKRLAPSALAGAAGGAFAGTLGGAAVDAAIKRFKEKNAAAKPPCNKCKRTDWNDMRCGLCDKCAFKKKAAREKIAFFFDKNQKGEEVPFDQDPRIDAPQSFKEWFKPYPHQAKAVRRMLDNDGKLILAHDVGTGKSVSSMLGFEVLKEKGRAKKALVVVPAGLRENYVKKNIEKFLTSSSYQIVGTSSERSRPGYVRPDKLKADKDYTVISYSMFRRDPIGIMERTGADTIIADEMHRARNETSGAFKALMIARQRSKNFIGLTGSLVNNDPKEVATMLTIAEGKREISPGQFRKYFTRTVGYSPGFRKGKKRVRRIQHKKELVKLVNPKVDYVQSGDLPGKAMPKKSTEFVDVPMSDDQYKLYQKSLRELGPVADYIVSRDPDVLIKDPATVFAQIAKARQVSNSMATARNMKLDRAAEETPKTRRLLDDTVKHLKETPDGKVVLYSNLVTGGVDVLEAGLKSRGIDPAVFVGKGREIGKKKITSKVRDQGVSDFQEGKKKVIILSGAGAEGLNLPNATAFYSLDGHFNPERILQAEARARRLGGQSHRAPEKRVVDVNRYRSVVPDSKRPGTIGKMMGKKPKRTVDEWVYDTAGQKLQTNKDFYSTIKEPHKYIRKYRDPKTGKIRYEYRKKNSTGWFGKVFG